MSTVVNGVVASARTITELIELITENR